MPGSGEDHDEVRAVHPIKLVDVDILAGRSSIVTINHGDHILGKSFCAVVDGAFPCKKSTYYNRDAEGCGWCQDLINRIKSRRIF